jgi:hypothetical protein
VNEIQKLIDALKAKAAALEVRARAAAEAGILVAEADVTRVHDVVERELAALEAKLQGGNPPA